jgi:hypothetical protein
MIPALEQIIKRGGALGVKEIVLGMAHRGRMNVLAQVMGKLHRVIFHEFKGGSATTDEVEGSGDVSIIWARPPTASSTATPYTSRSPPIRRTSKSSIRWCSARCAPAGPARRHARASRNGDAIAHLR